jgi:uncharacterized Fe-S center protein
MTKTSKVYFTDMRTFRHHNMLDKLELLMDKAGIEQIDFKDKFTAIKLHFGEPGNLAYIRPNYAARVVSKVKSLGGKPFLTDCNNLYHGKRSNALDHLQTAMENGFNYLTLGCQVIIADGLEGTDCEEIPVNFKQIKTAKIGAAIAQADVMVSLTHFKGHGQTGFGGALKNLGMGCGSRRGKLEMHSSSSPKIDEKVCIACGSCIKDCPETAITYNDQHKAQIDEKLCIGCGQCIASCHYGAVKPAWDPQTTNLNQRIAEYAFAVLKDRPSFHVSFIMNVSPECDCWSFSDKAIVPDIGMAASFDPVALDHACVDLVNQAEGISGSQLTDKNWHKGADKFQAIYPDTHWADCLKHAEEIGLGNQTYEIIQVK